MRWYSGAVSFFVWSALFVWPLHGDIYRWDNGQVIPGTEGITPGPGVNLSSTFSHPRNLAFANFSDLDLRDATYTGSRLAEALFRDANLTGASFYSSTLTNANLSDANLTGAYFVASTLTNANLTDAGVSGANFGYTTQNGFNKEQLYSTASYQQKNLQGVLLYGNELTGWDFSQQDLTVVHHPK